MSFRVNTLELWDASVCKLFKLFSSEQISKVLRIGIWSESRSAGKQLLLICINNANSVLRALPFVGTSDGFSYIEYLV